MGRPSTSARWIGAPLLGLVLALSLGACNGGGSDDDGPGAASSPTATPPPTATAAPAPADDACYRLDFEEAVSPTSTTEPRACARSHTAETYQVGRVDNVEDGHLLAIDSDRVQDQVAQTCRGAFGAAVGGDEVQQRLSMLRPVWFTPTLEQSDTGADWYRCDLVALLGGDRLTPLTDSLRGVLDTPEGRERYGMCGTAAPDADDFERVPCRLEHSWRAVDVVPLAPAAGGAYPGADVAREAGQQQCEDAGRAAAADPLDFDWGYEFPEADQWDNGQTFGRCWVPD